MFAAVNGNIIQIYSVTSFDNILNLKGHNGKVSQLEYVLQRSPSAYLSFLFTGISINRCVGLNGAWTTAGSCLVGWMGQCTSGTRRVAGGSQKAS